MPVREKKRSSRSAPETRDSMPQFKVPGTRDKNIIKSREKLKLRKRRVA